MPSSTHRPANQALAARLGAAAVAFVVLLAACEDGADDGVPNRDEENVARSAAEEGGDVAISDPGDADGENGEEFPAGDAQEPTASAAPTAPADATEHHAAIAEPTAEPEGGESPSGTTSVDTSPADPPQRIDLRALFIDSAPIPQATLTPQLATLLDHIRSAMRQREFLEIRGHLQAAAAHRRSAADRQAYERMLLVHALWTQGWSHAAGAAGDLGPGDRLDTWAGPALVQDKTDRRIMLRIDGAPQTFSTRIGDMEVRLAASLLQHRARETGLALDGQVAALWTFAPEADEDGEDPLPAAEEAIIEAAQRGVYVDHLIAELAMRRAAQSAPE